MCLKSRIFIILLIGLLIVLQALCEKSLRPVEMNNDTSIISDTLHEIVDEFFIKEKITFQINIFKELLWPSSDIIEDFMAKNDEKFQLRVYLHKKDDYEKKTTFLFHSSIFFVRNIFDLIDMEMFYHPTRRNDQAVKYFVFIPGLTYDQLKNSELIKMKFYKILYPFADFMLQYEFFILNEPETVTLATVEWFSTEKCGEPHLRKVNVFHKKSMKWATQLINYEKFLQYHGCDLTLMSPKQDNVTFDTSNYVRFTEDYQNINFFGIVPKVFEIASKIYNFSPFYQSVILNTKKLDDFSSYEYEIYKEIGPIKNPNVYFSARTLIGITTMMRRSNAFLDLNYFIAATPAEAYTPYEKLFLPFDFETWIFLIITFFITFLSIFFINLLSKSTQAIVYGHQVDTPFWNVISIFFGISQTRLPNKNFSRFILILFVFFCLIFRTCFQSKFFEFMTSEPRRPPPKTIEDLIDNNYTMYLSREHNNDKGFFDERLRIQYISIFKFYEIFNTQSQNSSAKAALCVDELTQNHIELHRGSNHDWIEFQDAHMVSHDTFVFPQFAFYFRMFRKMINRLIDTGVIKYLSDNNYTKRIIFKKLKPDPKVLNLDDMAFGFNIWLGSCCISFIAFLTENIVRKLILAIKRKSWIWNRLNGIKKIKFAKIRPLKIKVNESSCILKPKTMKKFRVPAKNTQCNVDTSNVPSPEVSKDLVKKILHNEEIAFGPKVSCN